VRLLGQFVDDGQLTLVVTHVTQFGDEVIGDVIDWSDEASYFRLAHHPLAELGPVPVPLAALPTTSHIISPDQHCCITSIPRYTVKIADRSSALPTRECVHYL